MKKFIQKYFNLYRANYDKLTISLVVAVLIFSLLSLLIPVLQWCVALLILSLIPVAILNFILLNIEMHELFNNMMQMFKKNQEEL